MYPEAQEEMAQRLRNYVRFRSSRDVDPAEVDRMLAALNDLEKERF